MGKFVKGKSGNPKGKPKGAVNKCSITMKELLSQTLNELKDDDKCGLKALAEKDPKTFWIIASRLLPQEVQATAEITMKKVPYTLPDGTVIFI